MIHPALTLLCIVLALAACSDSATTVEFAQACRKENDGKTVRTTGYLHAPFAGLCRDARRGATVAKTCSFDLRDKPQGTMRLSLSIDVGRVGRERNRVDEARLEGKQRAAAVVDDNAEFLADTAHVRVTGILHAMPNSLKPDETICWLDVTRIERR